MKIGFYNILKIMVLVFMVGTSTKTYADDPSPQNPCCHFTYPEYQILRYNEDWSVLRCATPEEFCSDYWNRFKYIPLGKDSWLTFGGQMRDRVEYWNNFDFLPGNTDTFNLWRTFLHMDAHLTRYFRIFVEGISALSTPRDLVGGIRPSDEDKLGLQQAFIDLNLFPTSEITATTRVGRQEYLFGKQRLVSPAWWLNTMRTWQGVSEILKSKQWQVTLFGSELVPVVHHRLNSNSEFRFNGIYSTYKLSQRAIDNIDLYWLYINNPLSAFASEDPTATSVTHRDRRHTVGARMDGYIPLTCIDYDIEYAHQFGNWGGKRINAFMVASLLGYNIPLAHKPRVTLGFDYASGGNPLGSAMNTFNLLFPPHDYLGYINVIGRQNIIDLHEGLKMDLIAKCSLEVDYHYFWRANRLDGLYDNAGNIVRVGGPGTSKNVGSELDTLLSRKFGRHFEVTLGYSHFFAGKFIGQTGPNRSINFGYAQLLYEV